LCTKLRISFISYAQPGYDATAVRPDEADRIIPRSLDKWKIRLEIAKRYMDPEIKLVHLTTFDDEAEMSSIEPTDNWGFSYLETVKDVFYS